jgi:hypothetical protein
MPFLLLLSTFDWKLFQLFTKWYDVMSHCFTWLTALYCKVQTWLRLCRRSQFIGNGSKAWKSSYTTWLKIIKTLFAQATYKIYYYIFWLLLLIRDKSQRTGGGRWVSASTISHAKICFCSTMTKCITTFNVFTYFWHENWLPYLHILAWNWLICAIFGQKLMGSLLEGVHTCICLAAKILCQKYVITIGRHAVINLIITKVLQKVA